jgi:pimeloyl-ACP methyl ester carboxylesterase
VIEAPVVCSYGSRSPDFIVRCTRSLVDAIPSARMYRIEGAAHAALFDAPANFVELIAETVTGRDGDDSSKRGLTDRESVHQGRREQ